MRREQLGERRVRAHPAAIGVKSLIDVTASPGGASLRFGAGSDTRQQLEQIVAAESTCCAFMRFGLDDEDGAIVLTIQAPDGAELVTENLAAAFRGRGVTA